MTLLLRVDGNLHYVNTPREIGGPGWRRTTGLPAIANRALSLSYGAMEPGGDGLKSPSSGDIASRVFSLKLPRHVYFMRRSPFVIGRACERETGPMPTAVATGEPSNDGGMMCSLSMTIAHGNLAMRAR